MKFFGTRLRPHPTAVAGIERNNLLLRKTWRHQQAKEIAPAYLRNCGSKIVVKGIIYNLLFGI